MSARIVLGVVVPSAGSGLGERIDEIARWMSTRIGVPIERRDAASYEALATDVREARTDVAWLPPIVYVRLGNLVTPLGSMVRGATGYEAALIVPTSSRVMTIDALRGARAGWVDRWSAAGFVLPRVKLALLGIDPRTLFRTETFHGSHRSLVKALMEGACDVAGTYARADANGTVTSGSWSEVEGADVRVLATFGAIPPDVLAVRTAVAGALGEPAFAAFKGAFANPSTQPLVREVFGSDDITQGLNAQEQGRYDALDKALQMATARGIFD